MKKCFLTAALFICTAFNSFADEGRGSCTVKGTDNDYVEVTAYSNGKGIGNFVIANSSSKPLMSVYVVIKAEVLDNTTRYEERLLYSGNYLGKVEPYQSTNVDFTYPSNYSKIRNITVEVSNPTCINNN